jgi:hypothetical protein
MARNIEIKARVADASAFAALETHAMTIADDSAGRDQPSAKDEQCAS